MKSLESFGVRSLESLAGLQSVACRNRSREQVTGDREKESGRKESGEEKNIAIAETICRDHLQKREEVSQNDTLSYQNDTKLVQ